MLRLAFEPNIEMRLFNPLAGARGSTARPHLQRRSTTSSRIQQRMHNKLFIADNALGVTGGRNLGDAYFGNGESGNFVDLDVLAAGPIVQDLSRSFDRYWNNERAYPGAVAGDARGTRRIRDRRAPPAAHEAAITPRRSRPTANRARTTPRRPPNSAPAPGTRSRWTCASAAFVWAPAVVLVDKPAKIPPDRRRRRRADTAPRLVVTPAARRPTGAARGSGSLEAAAGTRGRRRDGGRRPAAADRPGAAASC